MLKRPAQGILLWAGIALGTGAAIYAIYDWWQWGGSGGRSYRSREEPLRVEARGMGRKWHFSYAGVDGIPGNEDDQVTTGELRLPENAEVVIQLRSKDFIYVFSCPDLNLKEIAVPDLEFSITFRTARPGRHPLAMDPMCGFPAAPGETMGQLQVVSESEFQSWLGSCFLRAP